MKISSLQFEQFYIERKKELHAAVSSPISDLGFLIALLIIWSWLSRGLEILLGQAEIRIQKAPDYSLSRDQESSLQRSFDRPESYFKF